MTSTDIWMALCILTMLVFIVPGLIGAAKHDKEDHNE